MATGPIAVTGASGNVGGAVVAAARRADYASREEMAAASTGVGTLVYLHSGGPASLRLRWSAGALRLGVWDTDPTPPDDRGEAADCDGEAGRGLLLVKCVRPTSGVSFLVGDDVFGARGKYVWCELGTKADLERWDTAA